MAAENFSFFLEVIKLLNISVYWFILESIYPVDSKLNRDKTVQNLLKVSSLIKLLTIILPLVWIKIKSNNFTTLKLYNFTANTCKILYSEALLFLLFSLNKIHVGANWIEIKI